MEIRATLRGGSFSLSMNLAPPRGLSQNLLAILSVPVLWFAYYFGITVRSPGPLINSDGGSRKSVGAGFDTVSWMTNFPFTHHSEWHFRLDIASERALLTLLAVDRWEYLLATRRHVHPEIIPHCVLVSLPQLAPYGLETFICSKRVSFNMQRPRQQRFT